MRKSIIAAAAIVLALAATAHKATAMPVATPGQLGLAEGAAGNVEKAVLVCGPFGCYWRPWGWYRPYPYWGWRRHWGHRHWGHRHWGWHRHWRRW